MAESDAPNPPYYLNEKYTFAYDEMATSVAVLKDLGPSDYTVYHEWYRKPDLNNPIWTFEHNVGCCAGLIVSVSNRLGSDPDMGPGEYTLKFKIGVTGSGNFPIVAIKDFTIQPPICKAPSAPYPKIIGHTWFDLQWDDPVGVDGDYYKIQQREKGTNFWVDAQDFASCTKPVILIFGPLLEGSVYGLKPCTEYEFKVVKTCKLGGIAESPSSGLIGTGECDNVYFTAVPLRFSAGKKACSVIESIQVDGKVSVTNEDCDGGIFDADFGYEFYTTDTVLLEIGKTHELSIETDGTFGTHHAAAWIDFNNNKFFDSNPNEKIFSGSTTQSNPCSSTGAKTYTFTVPTNAAIGVTRMRVSTSLNNVPQPHNGSMANGKVQDFVVEIRDPNTAVKIPTLLNVQGGSFNMGCTDEMKPCEATESPAHNVSLPDFSIGKYEITQAEWQTLMGSNPSNFSGCGGNCPVERVSWFDALVYCNRLSERLGLQPCYYADAAYKQVYGKSGTNWTLPNSGPVFWKKCANGYRLPTEAEWEFAARGGIFDPNAGNATKYAGGNNANAVAWHNANANARTNPVGQKQANELGLYDMCGNVWEWCFDWFANDYYATSTCCSPYGPSSGTVKMTRGGSWFDIPKSISARNNDPKNIPDRRTETNLGFRIAKGGGGDSLALVDLHKNTKGANWNTKWTLTQPMTKWYGLKFNADGCVDTLNLGSNNLDGTLPATLGNLTHLRVLNLSTNKITGTVPNEVGRLVNLTAFNLSQNKNLGGSMPVSIGNLNKLTGLYLNECNFTGTIPAEWGQLANLDTLNLSKNQLSDASAVNVANWAKLKQCYWNENQFKGGLPVGFASIGTLRHLNLSKNQFSGSIPAAYGNFSAIDTLYLNNNLLSGCLDDNLKKICSSKVVSIAANPELPTQNWAAFCANNTGSCLPGSCNPRNDSLTLVTIFNTLAGTTWTKKDNWLVKGTKLDDWWGISSNNDGCVTAINLSDKKIEGNLPDLDMPLLEELSIVNSSLRGALPPLSKAIRLKRLYLYGNSIDGPLPTFTGLNDIVTIDIDNNQFSSAMPDYSNLKNLEYLDLGYNKLSGGIKNLDLPKLRLLDLNENDLSGNIPPLDKMPNLQTLGLAFNALTGPVPNFNKLPKLARMYLNNNKLSGKLPAFDLMAGLDTLVVDNNKFTFDGMENLVNKNYPIFAYVPQDSFFTEKTYTLTTGQSLTIDLGIDATVTGNQYQWIKTDGSSQPVLSSNTRSFTSLKLSDAGTYYVQVINPKVPFLTLYSRKITLLVCSGVPPSLSAPQGDTLTCTNTSLILKASAGASYTWSDGTMNNQPSIIVNQPGTYTVTVTDANGCKATATRTITENKVLPNASATGGDITCSQPNLTIKANSNALNVTYTWSGGIINNQSTIVNQPGIYTVTVTNQQNGCSTTATAEAVPKNTPPSVLIVGSAGLCNGKPILLDAGSGFNQYKWSNNATAQSINANSAGIYTVIVTGSNGCTASASKTVQAFPILGASLENTLPAACNQSNGIVTAVPLGGGGGFAYQWADLSGSNQPVQRKNIKAGPYTVTITDANLCTAVASGTLNQVSGPTLSATPQATTCNQNNGGITLIVSNGTPNYTFDWADLGGPNEPQNRSALAAGVYNVTVTDTRGCAATASATVAASQPGPTLFATAQATTCNQNNGSITLNVSNGTPNYAFDWVDLGGPNQPQNRSALAAGVYSVKVTDARGCTATTSASVALSQSGSTPQITGPNGICNGQPIVLNAGAGFSKYQWSSGTISNQQSIIVTQAGTYSVTVTDVNGCTGTATKAVQAFPILNASIEIKQLAACGQSNGTLTAKPIGGAGVFSYQWADLSGSNQPVERQNVKAGPYVVTIADANGCTADAFTTLTEVLGPMLSATAKATTCNQPNGGITLNISGGTPNYVFDWADLGGPNEPQNRSALSAGMYSVIVTDARGCTATASASVAPSQSGSTPQITGPAGFCNGQSILLDAGTGYSKYEWSVGTSNNQQSAIVNQGGTYTVTVTDNKGCTASATKLVQAFPALSANLEITLPATCNQSNGIITAVPVGGGGGFIYQWADLSSSNQPVQRKNVKAGPYSVTITDANLCTAVASGTLNQVSDPTLTATPQATTCNQPNGGITLDISGGTPNYTFDWADLNGANDPQNRSLLVPSTYSVTVTDASGCTATASAAVDPSQPGPTAQIKGPTALCNGQPVLLDAGGGFSQYNWSGGTISNQQSTSVNQPGIYTVTVSDVKGCTATDSHEVVTTVAAPEPQIMGPNALCEGKPIQLKANTFGAIAYLWSTNDQGDNLWVTKAGVYTVTVSFAAGCTATQSITIGPNAPKPDVSIQGKLVICGGEPTTLTAIGTGLMNYAWSNGEKTAVIKANLPGFYTVLVENTAGCVANAGVEVKEVPQALKPTITGIASICESQPAALKVEPNYLGYQWSSGQSTQQVTLTVAGSYTVTITDQNTCTNTATRNVKIGPKVVFDLGADMKRCTIPANGIRLDAGSADTYSWSNGSNLNTITVKQFGTYTATITQSGCKGIDSIKIIKKEPIAVTRDTFICPGVSFKFCNKTITAPGKQTCKFTTLEGCDSTLTLNISILDPSALIAMADTFNMPLSVAEQHIDVSANDIYPATGYWLEYLNGPFQGTAKIDKGLLLYQPNAGATRRDSLLYLLCPKGGCPSLCDTAQVLIRFQNGTLEKVKKSMPNFITPGSDGQNDFFCPLKYLTDNEIFPDADSEKLYIFNRWGEVIHQSEDGCWDGKKHGAFVPKATYYFSFEFKVGGETEWIKGAINVIR